MPLTRRSVGAGVGAAVVATLAVTAPAAAGAQDGERFFRPPPDVGDGERQRERGPDEPERPIRGSLTSTTFGAFEAAGEATPVAGDAAPHESEVARFYTDLHGRMSGDDVVGGMDLHGDLRLRLAGDALGFGGLDGGGRLQSGALGGHEFQIRQLYATRSGGSADYRVGRQVVGELAATRIDGVRMTYDASDHWDYLGFAGLYPARTSRSITSDYPRSREHAQAEAGAPILPITAGGGTAYRYDRVYGSLGLVGIAPLAEDAATGEMETPRVFATSSGYWRQSLSLDLFHHLVVDATGAAGAGIRNLHLGARATPADDLQVTASVTRVDTETLNVIAQRRLRDRVAEEGVDGGLIQNHVEVGRIAQDSARLGVSGAVGEGRFELSTSGTLRRRPDVRLSAIATDDLEDDDPEVVIPSAQAADLTFRAVDRRSVLGLRLEASLTEIFGVGANNLNRARSRVVRFTGSRPYAEGRGRFELRASYLNSADEFRGDACFTAGDVLTTFDRCYGTTALHSGTFGGVLHYRMNSDWMATGGVELGLQRQTTVEDDSDAGLQDLQQPGIFLTSGFARIAYRF